jgi:hypothetical protein
MGKMSLSWAVWENIEMLHFAWMEMLIILIFNYYKGITEKVLYFFNMTDVKSQQ